MPYVSITLKLIQSLNNTKLWIILPHSDPTTSVDNLLQAVYSKTYWPVTTIDRTFLPHFPLASSAQRNRFTNHRLLERGAFGVVYEVTDEQAAAKEDRRRFALKTLAKSQVRLNLGLTPVNACIEIFSS